MSTIIPEYESKNDEKQIYLCDLKKIVIDNNSSLEGNCFYYHTTLIEYPELYSKQVNLFWCGKQAVERMCEIGFNAGHSSMLLLLGRDNTPLNFTIFDIGQHSYTAPCYEYIKSKFPYVNFEYIEGDSTVTMGNWINNHNYLINTYDVVHVDGGHSENCISSDMKNADLLVKTNGIIIVDDTNDNTINSYVNMYIESGNYVEVKILPTYGYQHRVIQKVK